MDKQLRRQFTLPQEDVNFLEQLGLPWETIRNGALWLVIYGYPIPEGYNVRVAEVALMIPPGYDAAQIDMAYFHPHLQKNSTRGINATAPQPIDNRSFQRWSRHREANQWVPGVDNIATHLILVDSWLINDLNR